MLIAGFQKLTLLDYPGKLAALIFTQGCNFACDYCHNPEMIPQCRRKTYDPRLDPQAILKFLERRQGLLDGVVISGGEPTLQPDLQDFMAKIKAMGYLIKLDTNGSNPQVLTNLIHANLLNYIAMDIKHTPKKYLKLVKNDCSDSILESINIIKNAKIDYEFRSTILPFFHSKDDIREMGKMIKGAEKWYLQTFRPHKTLSRKLNNQRSFTQKEMQSLQKATKPFANLVEIRT
jgi:pyruvate formate lyase activating enzyme